MPGYDGHFQAITYTVMRSGFTPRCARESDDGGEVRIDKISRIIRESAYGIHDISKTDPDPTSGLPRFNMPFELGLYLGARTYGGPAQKRKKLLILDREQYRYQRFISDIGGQDIHAHSGRVDRTIQEVATWLRDEAHDPRVPGGREIAREFARLRGTLPTLAGRKRLEPEELTFSDLQTLIAEWIVATNSP